ncbi:hypothetical protein [Arenimonas sp.]|uniref:bestrophin-like domain n=1 Tax=Arenimonas sp. TaxID=1872635 RepID=UPI0025C2B336|nr:hypothetical protein [Arenimonas sp.]
MALGLLGNVDAIWIALGLLAVMLLAHEVAFRRAGRVRRTVADPDAEASTGLESSISLLLGLLLAFSFSMAAGRYEQRQDLVIAEANAIGTAWLRCDLLEPDAAQACRDGLREYTHLRLAIYEAPYDPALLADLVARSQRSLDTLWRTVADAAVAAPSPNLSLVVQAMNDVIDRHGERIAAYRRHVPDEVILMLLGLCLAWAAFTGHAQGWMGRRFRLGWPVFAVLVSLLIYITFDFDRQKRGFIRLDATQSLYDLRDSMGP